MAKPKNAKKQAVKRKVSRATRKQAIGKKRNSKKIGRNFTVEQVAEALRASGGMLTEAARMLGVHVNRVSRYIQGSPELQEVMQETVEARLDIAESKLMSLIEDANLGAICFYLKCKGKHRGYVERQEISGGPSPLQFVSYEAERLSKLSDEDLKRLDELTKKLTTRK